MQATMSRMVLGCLVACLVMTFTSAMPHRRSVNSDYRVVCYFTNWAQYRPGSARFVPGNVDPSLCTHVLFSFAKLSDSLNNKLEPYEWNDESTEWAVGNYEALNNLKVANPSLKTMLAVGGWTHGVAKFTHMASTPQNRQVFIQDAIQFLRQRNFDGLDLDWEFPGYSDRGSPPSDKFQFTLLVQELRAAFEAEAVETNQERLLLSSACSAGQDIIETGYEIDKVARALDFINVMAYDLHGSWDPVTGHHTSLCPGSSDVGSNLQLTVSNAVEVWLRGGAPASKLTLGMGLYGRSFTLRDQATGEDGPGVGEPVRGAGTAGVATREAGFLSYYEICSKLQSGELVSEWDEERMVPYAYNGNQWVGYDDPQSLKIKVNYLMAKGLGGAMVWAIDLDDFNGDCGEQWPLMKTINRALSTGPDPNLPAGCDAPANVPATNAPADAPATDAPANVPATDTPADAPATDAPADVPATDAPADVPATDPPANVPTTNQASTKSPATHILANPPATNAPATNAPTVFTCPGDGYYPDPVSCQLYYVCNGGIANRLPCPSGLHYDPKTSVCDAPLNAGCEVTDSQPPFCDGRADGLYTDPEDCSKFYQCSGGLTYSTQCQAGLLWNVDILSCDWSDNVDCDQSTDTVSTKSPATDILTNPPASFCEGRVDGLYTDPEDCSKFYQCSGGLTYSTQCQAGLLWNADILSCDWSDNVDCDRSTKLFCQDLQHGYYPDPLDCTRFYHCAGGKTYRKSCGELYWNQNIGGCDFPSNVQCIPSK